MQHPQGVRFDRGAVRSPARIGNVQLARIRADLIQERAIQRWCAVGITGAEVTCGIQDFGAVAHAQADGMFCGKTVQPFAHIGCHGVAAAGRLQADKAAIRRRRTD
jgi:hypothetical protein